MHSNWAAFGWVGRALRVPQPASAFDVVGHDAFKGAYEKAPTDGIRMLKTLKEVAARMLKTLKEVADQADKAVISMVRDYPQSLDIIFGEDALLSAYSRCLSLV